MPIYNNLNEFLQLVRAANPGFRESTSSLQGLIAVLKDENGNAGRVSNALETIPPQKANKYRDALYYLVGTYANVVAYSIDMEPSEKTQAVLFSKVEMPADYNSNYDINTRKGTLNRVKSDSIFCSPPMTVEQFILEYSGNIGVILIHLSTKDEAMKMIFDGRTVIDHINSVLRVARRKNCEICILTMVEKVVIIDDLEKEVNNFDVNRIKVVTVTPQHMGARDRIFKLFAENHDAVVVIGFDADVCVRANLFGCPEQSDDGNWVRPLVTLTKVVTSRALLITSGVIQSEEYGVLHGM